MTELWSVSPRARRVSLALEVFLVGLGAAMTLLSSASLGWTSFISAAFILTAVVTRRRSLALTAALAALGALVQLIGRDWISPLAELGYVPILYAFGSARDARWRRFGLASAGASLVLGPLALLHYEHPRGADDALLIQLATTASMSALVTFGGWMAGYLRLQQRLRVETALAAQVSNAERARLEESYAQSAFREHIAAEMHDVVGHSWAVVAAQAEGARYALRTSPEKADEALETIADIARSSITELREILRQLRYTEEADGQDVESRQEELFHRMRDAGLRLEVHETGAPPESATFRLTAHRLLAEALTNALKHGDASRPVVVEIDWTDGLALEVTNAIAARSDVTSSGLGLVGLRERAHARGGTAETWQADGAWHLRVRIPPPPSEEKS